MQNCAKRKKYWFYTFWSKNTHINGCKIVHKCTIVKITVNICTVTVACVFNILLFFLSPPHSLFFSLVWLSTSFEFPLFPNDYNNSAMKKKKNRKTPTQHNPTITTATYTQRKTHSKSKPKSIKTKSNGKPIWKIQHKPTWKTQWKLVRSAVFAAARSTLLLPPHMPCCRRRICLVAIARSNPNGIRLTWVCVEVKFFGLFMEFFGKERGKRRKFDRWRKMRERRKRKKIHRVRERERE